MNVSLVCWKCGEPLGDDFPLPLGRADECKACRADLHVCRMCRFYDTAVAKHCREPIADEVKEKERSNFCGYLEPIPNAHRPADTDKLDQARSELAKLFGEDPDEDDNAMTELERAKRQLEALTRDKDK